MRSEVAARGRCKRSTLAEAQRADRGLMGTARGERRARGNQSPKETGILDPREEKKKGTRKKRRRVERKGRRGWEKEKKETGRKRDCERLRETDYWRARPRRRRNSWVAAGGQQWTRALQTAMPLSTGLNYLAPAVLMLCALLVFSISLGSGPSSILLVMIRWPQSRCITRSNNSDHYTHDPKHNDAQTRHPFAT